MCVCRRYPDPGFLPSWVCLPAPIIHPVSLPGVGEDREFHGGRSNGQCIGRIVKVLGQTPADVTFNRTIFGVFQVEPRRALFVK